MLLKSLRLALSEPWFAALLCIGFAVIIFCLYKIVRMLFESRAAAKRHAGDKRTDTHSAPNEDDTDNAP